MTIHETRTSLTPAEVVELARSFFALAATPYAAFPVQAGEGFLKLHMEVGEILIAALPKGESTWVRGSASRGSHLLTRFLTSLSVPLDAKRTVHRYGQPEARPAQRASADDRTAPGSGPSIRPAAQAA